jgi:uncharacterized protein (DUF2384 family)
MITESRRISDVITSAHEVFGIEYTTMSRLANVDRRTVLRWKERSHEPSSTARQNLLPLLQLTRLLQEVFRTSEDAREWLRSSVPALGDRIPVDLLREGRIRPVVRVLATYQSGAFL